ncbi:MAG: hypothetical protein ACRELC_04165, partial [Gemmatimonadota bacterium]
MRGHPVATHLDRLVELGREGVLELPAELISASEEVARVDAYSLATREQAAAARERLNELEVGMV